MYRWRRVAPVPLLLAALTSSVAWPQLPADTLPQQSAPSPPLVVPGLSTQPTLPAETDSARPPGDPVLAATFRQAMQALEQGRYQEAIEALRWMLSRDPSLIRVRLELARAFFLAGDDDNAEYHFRLARTERLPAAAIVNIDRFLAAIEARRPIRFSFRFELAPDTNINSATNARQVTLFGLPFVLDEEARQTSGIGLSFGGTMRINQPVSDTVWFEATVALDYLDYSGSDFDDLLLSFQAGPTFRFDETRLGVAAIASRRIYGGDPYSRSYGMQVSVTEPITPRLAASGVLAYQELEYDQNDARDAGQGTLGLQLSYGLSSYSFARLQAGVSRTVADSDIYSSTAYQLGAGYYREFSAGFSLGLNASYNMVDYDSAAPLFGVDRREDRQIRLSVDLGLTRFTVFGFSPLLTYAYTDNDSNIPLYDYDRHQVLIGLRRVF